MRPEKFESFDKTILQCYLWNDVKNPKGVVQISHGMAEHARRYDAFAQFLNANGYIVYADDHRAHGMTSTKQSKKGVYGYHKGDIYNDTVRDEIAITAHLKERFGLPVVYLGHSYGSMLGQRYHRDEERLLRRDTLRFGVHEGRSPRRRLRRCEYAVQTSRRREGGQVAQFPQLRLL